MIKEYGRSLKGKRTIFETDDNYVFRKFTLHVAINNKKYIGYRLYKKGGMTKERLEKFLQDFVFGKHLFENWFISAPPHNEIIRTWAHESIQAINDTHNYINKSPDYNKSAITNCNY